MNGPSKTDYMRLAMAIDCEGMIDIHTHRQWRHHLRRVHTTHYVRIVVTNTDPRLVLWCKTNFGGTTGPGSERPRKKWKRAFKWYCSSAKAICIINGCMPYFILKHEQAEIALAFQATVKRIGRRGHSKETIQRRVDLQKQMKLAKRKNWPELSVLVH